MSPWLVRPRRSRRAPARAAGQGLVEFAAILPVFMLILLGTLEFGFAFNHHLTLQYATREGARAGAAMADGTITDSACGGTQLTSANVDPLIVATVQRVLQSPGSMVDMARISDIQIYRITNGGSTTGEKNIWIYRPGTTSPGDTLNPVIPCQSPSQRLDFYQQSATWPASARTYGPTPDSIGVSITYTYQFRSALGGILLFFGGNGLSSLTMTDRTVMAIEPTS